MTDLEQFELAAMLVDLPESYLDEMDYDKLDELLIDKYGSDYMSFGKIVTDLIPLITIAKSELTNKVYKGFALDGLWYGKKEVNND